MRALIGSDIRTKIPSSRMRMFSRMGLFDIVWASATPALAFLVRDGAIKFTDDFAIYASVALLASLAVFQWFRISAPISHFFSANDAGTVIKASLTAVAVAAVVTFTFTRLSDAPRSVPLIHFMLLAGGLIGWRSAIRLTSKELSDRIPNCRHEDVENILVIGATRLARYFISMLDEFAGGDRRILGVLDERRKLHGRTLNGYTIIGSSGSLARIIDEYAAHGINISKIIVAADSHELTGAAWIEIKSACSAKNIKMEWLSEHFLFSNLKASANLRSIMANEDKRAGLDERPYWRIKRALDFVLALGILIVLAPLMMLVALLVLMDVGYPIVFWQQRLGQHGHPLYVYKFRTMRSLFDREGRKIHDSDRVSLLGRLLQRNQLDEIPQLFNVLVGHMSLVGPRPLLPVDQPENLRARLQVKPGISGLAQINGGKLLTAEEKDVLDDRYIQRASLWLDLKIIVGTVWVVLHGDRRNELEISSAVADRHFARAGRAATSSGMNVVVAKRGAE